MTVENSDRECSRLTSCSTCLLNPGMRTTNLIAAMSFLETRVTKGTPCLKGVDNPVTQADAMECYVMTGER